MKQIQFMNVTKCFGTNKAVNDITLSLEGGKVYGLLGRNGAGKTTLLNLLTNRLFTTSGEVLVDGEPVKENDNALSKIYFMSEANLYPETMTLKQAITWSKEFYPGLDEGFAYELSDKFKLDCNKKYRSLSTGYKSIYKLIIALSCNAEITLLDEPVLGLDANHRDMFYKELIKNYSQNPRTIIISTHLIEEAADMIEEAIIIKEGNLLMKDTVENLTSQGATVSGPIKKVDEFIVGRNVIGTETLGGLKSAFLLERLDKKQLPEGLELSRLNLQQLFIQLTNS